MIRIHQAVIIATCGRNALLQRALQSIAGQTAAPDRIVVVDDRPDADLHALSQLGKKAGLRLELLANRRTKGAAGAWNTALDHLAREPVDPRHHLVSFLDDDDWWDSDYLRNVHSGTRMGAEVMAGALTRHDADTPDGRRLLPPSQLSVDDFLVGNPGIQGSNLSARLSTLLKAGLFDEALSSCTDRDICIRLADLRPSYCVLPEAVAHHDTLHGSPRLSDPASPAKLEGLDVFHAKWRRRMTELQLAESAERALRYFSWSPTADARATVVTILPNPVAPPPSMEPLVLVVGVIIDGSQPARSLPLLDGLQKVSAHPLVRSLDVVLLENGNADGFQRVVRHGQEIGFDPWAVSLAEQQAAAAVLSLPVEDVSSSKTIAVARTLLQQFVYAVSHARNHAPAWILDDDFRVESDLDELVHAIIACRDSGIDVAIGGNSGAAPVPASSLRRTQLVDLAHFLQWAQHRHPDEPVPDADSANHRWMEGRQDYHYDLARGETDRLETPFLPHFQGATLREATGELLRRAERILAGEAISRPVQSSPATDPATAPDSLLRGGNTLVLDTSLLRDIPNMSPRIHGRHTRRSDMVWAANARYRFGKTIKSVRLPMTHDRRMERCNADDTSRLVDDILGYAFFRAYEAVLRERVVCAGSSLTDDERERVTRDIGKYADERLAAYRLSFWRSMGLTNILSEMVAERPWWLTDAGDDERAAFFRFLELLKGATALAKLEMVEKGIREGLRVGAFTEFLAEMERIHPDSPRPEIPSIRAWVERGRAERAQALLQRRLGLAAESVLGMGAEGVVLRLDDRAFKVFDRWSASQRQQATPLLAALHARPTNGALPEILATHDCPEAFVAEYRFADSQPYSGGHGPQVVAMLRDLRQSGWVHSNVCPKNLRLTADGLQLIDIGKSLEAATPTGTEMMVRRAFLSWRFAGRADLVTVMRKSMSDEFLPELTGWRALLEAAESEPSKMRLDDYIRGRVEAMAPRQVLDYGCGKPRDAARWTEAWQLTAFDIDPSLRVRWQHDAAKVQFWDDQALKVALTAGEDFDVIVCSLLLCAVDDAAIASILVNLRRLAKLDGRILVAICDPAALHVTHAIDQKRHGTEALDALLPARYRKTVDGSSTSRDEFHRSVDAYRRAFARAGLAVRDESQVTGFDALHLERVPEFLVFELTPLPKLSATTSLLITICALDAETALHQVRHLEMQLSRPRAFDELVLLVDPNEGPFPRAHCRGDYVRLQQAIGRLISEGVVDRVIDGFTDGAATAAAAHRWTGHAAHHAHCANGQPATAILAAFEQCRGEYILHVDVDVMIARPKPTYDHIAETVNLFEANPDVVTLALSVKGDVDPQPRHQGVDGQPLRTEAMAGWVARSRLLGLRPLPGGVSDGRLDLPWHRMLDIAVRQGRGQSLRCGSPALWFAAPDNGRKSQREDHLLLVDRMESGFSPELQHRQPLIQGPQADWLGPKRSEPLVVVICGRNVRPGAIDRCMASLRLQRHRDWGAVVIDDASDDGSLEVLSRACRWLGDRVTLIRRRCRVGLLANTFLAIRHLVAMPDTVVVLLDLDDALAHPAALSIVAEHYSNGADLTVGSMLRTDKVADYPVDFSDPRRKRGGNIWQHLRSFRKSLFDRIAVEDLMNQGQWIDLANDWAYMLPLVEMAENPVWIRQALYLYEPSTRRTVEEKAAREAIVERIVAKPAYRGRAMPAPRVTVLSYHRILKDIPECGPGASFHRRGMAVSLATMRSQMRAALRDYEPISSADFLAAVRGDLALPKNALLVTVDDGYRDFITTALPAFRQLGVEPLLFARMPAADGLPSWAPLDLLYVGRGLAGKNTPLPNPEWRARLLDMPYRDQLSEVRRHIGEAAEDELDTARRDLYMGEAELRSLQGCALGVHGDDHIRWTTLADSDLRDVVAKCWSWNAAVGGLAVAAYPDGDVDRRVATTLAAAGYQAAFALSSVPEDVAPNFRIRRIVMPDDRHFTLNLEAEENVA